MALFLSLGVAFPVRPPDLIGLATSYGPPAFQNGDVMRNGERLDLAAPTVAVNDCRKDRNGECLYEWDVPYWPQWAGKTLLVFVPDCGRFWEVRVTDTGYLTSAGWFRLGIRDGIQHYWALESEPEALELAVRVLEEPVVEADTIWLEEARYRVVVDFPEEFFRQHVSCGVMYPGPVVAVWVLE